MTFTENSTMDYYLALNIILYKYIIGINTANTKYHNNIMALKL